MTKTTQETTRPMSTDNLTESTRHQLLSTDRRRILLDVLGERPTPIDIETLAEAIAEREADGDAPSDDDIQRVELSLYHKHLPKMSDMGVINYDRETDQVL